MKSQRSRSSSHSTTDYLSCDEGVKPESVIAPISLERPVSPPPRRCRGQKGTKSATALVEAGDINVQDHLAFFSAKLSATRKPEVTGQPRLPHHEWVAKYQRNLHENGHHFVIHQHDHPVAGTHYDLRLQCNATSSISFAIMYGLPGDPDSRRLNRNATETRVHNLWNHLIETASHDTGTMLLWDTGEYEVLPYQDNKAMADTDDDKSDSPNAELSPKSNRSNDLPEVQKLHEAFSKRKVKLRLHGTRLPKGYTISLRLTQDNFRAEQPKRPSFRRRRKQSTQNSSRKADTTTDSEADDSIDRPRKLRRSVSSLLRTASPPRSTGPDNEDPGAHSAAVASDDEHKDHSESIRLSNAYPGATNDIGSIHQRRWFLSLDRRMSGFIPATSRTSGHRVWVRGTKPSVDADGSRQGRLVATGFEKFHVLGRDYETSVVTGRVAKDILEDEGVIGYVPRGKWRAVTE